MKAASDVPSPTPSEALSSSASRTALPFLECRRRIGSNREFAGVLPVHAVWPFSIRLCLWSSTQRRDQTKCWD